MYLTHSIGLLQIVNSTIACSDWSYIQLLESHRYYSYCKVEIKLFVQNFLHEYNVNYFLQLFTGSSIQLQFAGRRDGTHQCYLITSLHHASPLNDELVLLSFITPAPLPSCNTRRSRGFYQFSSERPRALVVRFFLCTVTQTNFYWSLQGLSLSPSNPFPSLSLSLPFSFSLSFFPISISCSLSLSFLSPSLSSLISAKGMGKRSEKNADRRCTIQYAGVYRG